MELWRERRTSDGGGEHGASSTLIDATCLEIPFCSSTVSFIKFRIFLLENEFSLAENEDMPGVEDLIPLVAITVLVHGVMFSSWACNMAPALEFMKITLVSHNEIACICLL